MSKIKEEFSNWIHNDEEFFREFIEGIIERGKAIIDIKRMERRNRKLFECLENNAYEFYKEISDYIRGNNDDTINNSLKYAFNKSQLSRGIREKDMDGFICFQNIPEELKITLGDVLLPEYNNKLVIIEGMIEFTTAPTTTETRMMYECQECGNKLEIEETVIDTDMKKNLRCNCGNYRKFNKTGSIFSTLQIVKIVEPVKSLTVSTRIPIFIWNNMVDSTVMMEKKIIPGKNFRVVGIVRQIPKSKKRRRGTENVNVLVQCLNWEVKGDVSLEITREDVKKIREISKRKDCIDYLVSSFCPSVYGYKKIKEAILLQLVGGVGREHDMVWKRGDIHILLAGDPSVGKSIFQNFLENWFPRTVYTIVGQSTSVGLGLALEKDPDLGIWVLKAGALVLASNGLAVLDEFHTIDKDQIEDLKSAMEQQVVTTAKAGIVSNIKIRTPILASMNPLNDSWDPHVPKIDQMKKVPEVLLSRFDLKFALEDIIKEDRDRKIIKTMFGKREKKWRALESTMLLKYILTARKKEPEIPEEVFEKMMDHAVDLRQKSKNGAVKIRFRQVESLRRLAEAEAKLRQSDVVTNKDFERAKEIVEESLRQFGFEPETGEYDVDRAEGRVSKTQKNQMETILMSLNELDKVFKDVGVPEEDLLNKLKEDGGMNKVKGRQLIEKLKTNGLVFEPKPGRLKRL